MTRRNHLLRDTARRISPPRNALPIALGAAALVAIPLVAWALWGPKAPVGNRTVPQPAKPVDLERYTGRWFELARYENAFEKGMEAVTATYTALPDGKIAVLNEGRRGGLDGKLRSAEGKAVVVADSGNARLKVSFFGPFYVGDYWVLDHADDYSWSIVGEPSGRYLWILARTRQPLSERRELTARIIALGYDAGLLRVTQQPPE